MRFASRPSLALAVASACLVGCQAPTDDSVRLRPLTRLGGDDVDPRFSPDGGRIALTRGHPGARDILVFDLARDELEPLVATADDEFDPHWSPDGSRVAFTVASADGSQSVWWSGVESGSSHRLSPPDLKAYRARWSPDGARVAFTVTEPRPRQVWLAEPDGALQALSDDAGDHIAYGWSPDGTAVLAISFAEEAHDLWALPVDGTAPRRLTDREGEEWWPTWSPDGTRVAFYTTYDDAMTDIWVTDVDTGALTQVTRLPVEDFRPAWSPDSEWLAFISDRSSKSGLWIQPPRSDAEARAVATGGRAGPHPAWSPDGRRIAFSYVTSPSRVYRVSRDGSTPRALTGDEHNAVEAVSAPDGGRIAFEMDGVGNEADLAVLDLATGRVTRLTDETTYNARPSWSPDGSMLTFERSPGGGPRTRDVGVLPTAGGAPRLLTRSGYVRSPVWCATKIVFTVEPVVTTGDFDQLWAVDVESGETRRLTGSPGDKRSTDCTPDGELLFHSSVDGVRHVFSARLSGWDLSEPRAHGPGEGGRWSPDVSEIALLSTRDGQPDLYIVDVADNSALRVTDSPAPESWPDWIAGTDELIFSANPGDRDIWLAELPASWFDVEDATGRR